MHRSARNSLTVTRARLSHTLSRSRLLVLLLILLSCSRQPEQPPAAVEQRHEQGDYSVTLRVDRNEFTVAESARIEIEATAPEDAEAVFPALSGLPEDIATSEPRLSDPKLVEGGRLSQTFQTEVEALLPGEYEIPALSVEFRDQKNGQADPVRVETEAVRIKVSSVLGDKAEEATIEEIVDPVDMSIPTAWIVGGVLAAAVLAAAGYWLWRRKRGPKIEGGPPPPPPDEVALEELKKLVARNLLREGREKLFYNLLSGILRRYIEDRFGLHAPERTTEEFLLEVRDAGELDREQKDLLRSFLRHSDLVKFAEVRPSSDEADRAVADCRRFIEQTREKPAEQPLAVASS